MPRKPLMNPVTLKTIINNAPLILQGANKLVQLIRDRNKDFTEAPQAPAATLEDLNREVQQIETRLKANDDSNVEQIKLIEELAKQNEALAESLRRSFRLVTLLTWLSGAALVCAVAALIILVTQ
jgi:hypothetical protein